MSCSIQSCGACVELANLNATKVTPQNFLDVIHQQHHHKFNLNRWHDRLVFRLPVEIVSRIFIFLDKVNEPGEIEAHDLSPHQRHHWDHLLRTPALLSRVCKTWRNITLTTPQLWTNLLLDVWTQSSKLELLQKILSRSGSLPLSLVLAGGSRAEEDKTPLEPLAKVIQEHSARWETLDVDYAPGEMANILLHNLDHTPMSDLLDLRLTYLDWETISLREPLRPRRFRIIYLGSSVAKMPFQWDNCTHLELSHVNIAALLSIVQQMPRLTDWVLKHVAVFAGTPFPITVPTVERLELFFMNHSDVLFFQYLTLPALTYLECFFREDNLGSTDPELVVDDLIDFVARSRLHSRTLQTFHLGYDIFGINYDRRFIALTTITHFTIDLLHFHDGIINPLPSMIVDISALPSLRVLRIEARQIPISSWTLLCEFLRGNLFPVNDGSQRLPDRPLELVSVIFDAGRSTKIPNEEYLFLRDIQSSGVVQLEVKDYKHGDILTKIPRIYESLDH